MLDAPAFGANALPVDAATEPATAVVSQTESGEQEPLTEPGEGSVTEQKVPYSRFETVSKRAREAEEAAEEAERRYDDLLSLQRQAPTHQDVGTQSYQGNLPNYWVKMYGDNVVSREAYSYELERQESIREEVRNEALEAVRQDRASEGKALSTNESIIDDRLDNLSSFLGRDMTSKEEEALLDIVDEYTPKDDDGNYAGDLIGFDKAWDIYQMSQGQTASRARQARSGAVMATASRTSGEPTAQAKDNSEFNPRDWNAYKRRL